MPKILCRTCGMEKGRDFFQPSQLKKTRPECMTCRKAYVAQNGTFDGQKKPRGATHWRGERACS